MAGSYTCYFGTNQSFVLFVSYQLLFSFLTEGNKLSIVARQHYVHKQCLNEAKVEKVADHFTLLLFTPLLLDK